MMFLAENVIKFHIRAKLVTKLQNVIKVATVVKKKSSFAVSWWFYDDISSVKMS